VAKGNKEYESIKTIKVYENGKWNEVDLKTVLTYTPSGGGKGWIIQVRTKK